MQGSLLGCTCLSMKLQQVGAGQGEGGGCELLARSYHLKRRQLSRQLALHLALANVTDDWSWHWH